MKKRYKQLIKKHVNIVKNMYPQLYIEIEEDWDEIFICIDSQAISNEVEYEAIIRNFIKEYHRKGYANIFWGVNSTLTCDKLDLLEDLDKIPVAENFKEKRAANF